MPKPEDTLSPFEEFLFGVHLRIKPFWFVSEIPTQAANPQENEQEKQNQEK